MKRSPPRGPYDRRSASRPMVTTERPTYLMPTQARCIADGFCPDCGHRGFVLGPKGGMMQNIECGSLECRARFNVAFNFLDSAAMFAHRIEREEDGGSSWGKPLRFHKPE